MSYFCKYLNLEIVWHTALSDAQYLKLNLTYRHIRYVFCRIVSAAVVEQRLAVLFLSVQLFENRNDVHTCVAVRLRHWWTECLLEKFISWRQQQRRRLYGPISSATQRWPIALSLRVLCNSPASVALASPSYSIWSFFWCWGTISPGLVARTDTMCSWHEYVAQHFNYQTSSCLWYSHICAKSGR